MLNKTNIIFLKRYLFDKEFPQFFKEFLPDHFYTETLQKRIEEIRELLRLGPVVFNAGLVSNHQSEVLNQYGEIMRRMNGFLTMEFDSSRQFFLYLLIILEISINKRDENLTLDDYVDRCNGWLQ